MNIEEQEALAKDHFRPKAAFMAGLVSGLLFLFVSRGFPWISSGLPDAVMGRPVDVQQGGFFVAGLFQMIASLLYAFIVGFAVFRINPLPAVYLGGAVGLVLYMLNYIIFQFVPSDHRLDEGMVMAIHVVFCMLAAACYKAFSVRKAY